MNLSEFRKAVVTVLTASVQPLSPRPRVEAHGGRFTLEELKRIHTRAPALFAATLAVRDVVGTPTGRVEADVVMGVFLIAATVPGVPRDAAALILVSHLLTAVTDQRWATSEDDISEDVTGLPRGLAAQNLYSAEADKNTVALWAVTWTQRVTLSALDDSALPDFTTWHAEYGVGETPDTENPTDDIEDLDQ